MFNNQKTIASKVSCAGIGLHSGRLTNLTLFPASENEGINFIRTDIKGKDNVVSANYNNVVNTTLGTTLSNDAGVEVSTVEHLMAALWGCGIDNCTIELDCKEIPIMDGSSEPFVFLIECAGIEDQKSNKKIIEVLKEVKVRESDAEDSGYISISPSKQFSVGLEIDFGEDVISKQKSNFEFTDITFKRDLCRARTFCFENEVNAMRENGLAKGGSFDNAIVVNEEGVLNEGGLRYANEFVRHKVLDCIGDVYLAGAHIKGHVNGFKSGHGLNNKLLKEFFSDTTAWRYVEVYDPNSATISIKNAS